MMMMMEPRTCSQWVNRCRENKCCRKAYNEAHYHCKEIIEWKNDTLSSPPDCSNGCGDAIKVLYDDPIGKNLRCCECGQFSDIDHNNFEALRSLQNCKRFRRNVERFCNVRELYNCSRPTRMERPGMIKL